MSRQREIENGKRAGQTSTRAFRWQVSACFDVVVIYERRTGTFSSASLPTRFYASAENSVYPCCEYQLFPMTLMTGEEQASTAFQSWTSDVVVAKQASVIQQIKGGVLRKIARVVYHFDQSFLTFWNIKVFGCNLEFFKFLEFMDLVPYCRS